MMIIDTDQTQNPDTLKFITGKKSFEIDSIEFSKNDKKNNVSLMNKMEES